LKLDKAMLLSSLPEKIEENQINLIDVIVEEEAKT
jgi:hypothetical protein